MKIKPPRFLDNVHPGLMLYGCIGLLLVILLLEAAWAAGHHSGIYENLLSEAIGVAAEIGIIYFLITKWVAHREQLYWKTGRDALFKRLLDAYGDLLQASSSLFDGLREQNEDHVRGALDMTKRAIERTKTEIDVRRFAISKEMSAGLSSYLDSAEQVVDSTRHLVNHYTGEGGLIRYPPALAKKRLLHHQLICRSALLDAMRLAGSEDPDAQLNGDFAITMFLRDLRSDVANFGPDTEFTEVE